MNADGRDALRLVAATLERVAVLCDLINQAYRGDGGWTRETALVAGNRITPAAVAALLEQPGSYLMMALQGHDPVACIHLASVGKTVRLGLFSVYPALQGKGLGDRVLTLAEAHAAQSLGADRITMNVLNRRPELIDYYLRRGYRRVPGTDPYPIHENVGTPRVDGLVLERLEKRI